MALPRLPVLPLQEKPNVLDGPRSTFFEACFLAPQRLSILQNIEDDFSTKPLEDSRGKIFSGPNGCGKSSQAYLLAAHAFMNGHCVLYIPSCRSWLTALDDNWMHANYAAQYALAHFYALNADLVDNMVINNAYALPVKFEGFGTVGQMLRNAVLKENVDVALQCEELLEMELAGRMVSVDTSGSSGKKEERPLRYYRIFDEVNHLYEPFRDPVSRQEWVPASSGYFSRFCQWNAPKNFFSCQVGSANSKGEKEPYLASGEQKRIVRIQPLPAKNELIDSPVCRHERFLARLC